MSNFKKRDKVNIIPWEQAVKTNLYNSVENEVYGIPQEDWFKFGTILDFEENDVLVGNINEVWFKFPPEFLTIAN
jgi:hypothetical protein